MWSPIATGSLARTASRAVTEIAAALRPVDPGNASLSHGDAGLALFFAHLAAARGDPADVELALALLDRALARVGAVPMTCDLFGGFVGVAWAATRIAALLGEDIAVDDAVGTAIAQVVAATDWREQPCGLAVGLTGLGVYALEHATAGAAIAQLAAVARALPDGIAWPVTAGELAELPMIRARAPDGCYDLGLAHGNAGVIAFLAHAAAAGSGPARALLVPATNWWLARARPDGPTRFARWWIDGPGTKPARHAWCTGDPGAAIALLAAARAVGDPRWEAHAIDLARFAAARPVDDPTCKVWDAGLCHGATGLAHVFGRLHAATGDAACADAARRWLAHALALPAGIAVTNVRWDRPLERRTEPGLLCGAAGTGLALLAATSSHEPTWDHALLLGCPGR